MSQRSEALAAQFEQVNDQFTSAIQGMSDEQWRATTEPEGWTAAAAAHHAVISYGPLTAFVVAASLGGPFPPITPQQLDEMNAQHANDFANVSKDDVLAVVKKDVPPTAAMLRTLTDEQLDLASETPFGMTMTTEQLITNVLIGHTQTHLASAQGAS